jgi:hypothetical protein
VARVVIQCEDHALGREDALPSHLGEIVERHRDRPVVTHRGIHAADNHVTAARIAGLISPQEPSR